MINKVVQKTISTTMKRSINSFLSARIRHKKIAYDDGSDLIVDYWEKLRRLKRKSLYYRKLDSEWFGSTGPVRYFWQKIEAKQELISKIVNEQHAN